MARSVEPWVGRNDDEAVPPRVRVRVYTAADGHCQMCTRKINAGERWVADHKIAIINGGANSEINLQLICDWCDRKVKTPADSGEKATVYAKKSAHLGVKKPRSILGWKKMNGQPVRASRER